MNRTNKCHGLIWVVLLTNGKICCIVLYCRFEAVVHKRGPQWHPPTFCLYVRCYCTLKLKLVQTGSRNCRGTRTTEGAWSSESTTSRVDSCEESTGAVKCWWDCQTKMEKWHIHQKGVRTTGRGMLEVESFLTSLYKGGTFGYIWNQWVILRGSYFSKKLSNY